MLRPPARAGLLAVLLIACKPSAPAPTPAPAPAPAPEPVPAPTPAPATLQKFTRDLVMHTFDVSLTVYAADQAAADRAMDAAEARMRAMFAQMNDWQVDPPSPLNRIAAAAGDHPVEIPPELMVALKQGVRMHALTGGAFDITAKPLTAMWRTMRELGQLPPPEAVAANRAMTGIGHLRLDETKGTAYLDQAGMWLDLGGLAKGYACDEAVAALRAHGCPRCEVKAGGDMAFGDPPPDQPEGWKVVVPDAPRAPGEPPFTLHLKNEAVSISGDVMRFVVIGGVRYSHVVDPRTGLGATERKLAVIRAPRGLDTDPLSKGGILMEEEAWKRAAAEVGGQAWLFRLPHDK